MTHLRTRAVHAGQHPDPATGAISTPTYQTTAFGYGTLEQGAALFAGEATGYRYSRFANPTVAALEAKLADLEGADAAVAFASGTAACSSLLLGLLAPGDELVFLGPCTAAPRACCAAWASAGASRWSMPRPAAWRRR
jgi:methionine-gamma-lyase